jgi:hypothetical protein
LMRFIPESGKGWVVFHLSDLDGQAVMKGMQRVRRYREPGNGPSRSRKALPFPEVLNPEVRTASTGVGQ